MSRNYKSIKAFKTQLMKDIGDSLNSGSSSSIEIVMHKAISEEVYDAYIEPKKYVRRRYGDGGLLSKESFWHDTTVDGNKARLVVENRAEANVSNPEYFPIEGSPNQYLTPLIVYGHGGQGGSYSYGDNFPYNYTRPRDFIGRTKEMLRADKAHRTGLWIALEDKGYETRTY